MKNLNKRTKMILAIVGIVVVLAVIGVVITQPPTSELLGTTALVIAPSEPSDYVRVPIGEPQRFIVNSVFKCNWFSSDPAVLSIVGDATEVKSVVVKSIASGHVDIEARCGLINVNQVRAHLVASSPPWLYITSPSYGMLMSGTQAVFTANGGNPSCTWRISGANASIVGSNVGASVTVKAGTQAAGTYSQGMVIVDCGASLGFYARDLVIVPTASY